jgi:hypothetical protein
LLGPCQQTFTINSIIQDATKTYLNTDLGAGTVPDPTFLEGNAVNAYFSLPYKTVTLVLWSR